MTSFRVDTEPWIPVVYADGTEKEIGLYEALTNAHEIRAVRDPLPLSELGVYRLLLAFVLDIFVGEPGENRTVTLDTDGSTELLQGVGFDADAVDAYFTKYADRFDLFSERYPFLQTPVFEDGGEKPIAGLLPPQPSGTFLAHFQHGSEDDFAVSPPVAARLLTTIAPFMTAGGAGLSPSVNGAPPWYVWMTGETLFQTLCRNLFLLFDEREYEAPPAWRDDRMRELGARMQHARYAEGLTWRPRKARLVPGAGGVCALTGASVPLLIRTMFFKPGDACEGKIWSDPNVAYYVSPEKPDLLPQRAKEDREVWRDTGPLALLESYGSGKERRFYRPLVLNQFARVAPNLTRPERAITLSLYGIRTDGKMKVFEWQKETLRLPVPLIENGAFAADAQAEMQNVEEVAGALRFAIKKNYEREGAGNKSAFDTRISGAARALFAGVRQSYDAFLGDLAALDPEGETLVADKQALRDIFRTLIRHEARQALEEATDDLISDANALMRRVRARAYFESRLATILFPKPKLPDGGAANNSKSGNAAKSTATPAPQTALLLG